MSHEIKLTRGEAYVFRELKEAGGSKHVDAERWNHPSIMALYTRGDITWRRVGRIALMGLTESGAQRASQVGPAP